MSQVTGWVDNILGRLLFARYDAEVHRPLFCISRSKPTVRCESAPKFEENRNQIGAVPTGKRERTSASKAAPASPACWLEKSSAKETHGIPAQAALIAVRRSALEPTS